jgi:hypothetical protein
LQRGGPTPAFANSARTATAAAWLPLSQSCRGNSRERDSRHSRESLFVGVQHCWTPTRQHPRDVRLHSFARNSRRDDRRDMGRSMPGPLMQNFGQCRRTGIARIARPATSFSPSPSSLPPQLALPPAARSARGTATRSRSPSRPGGRTSRCPHRRRVRRKCRPSV